MPTHCPFCGDRRIITYAGSIYRCAKCDRLFDDDPDEGGDFGNRPSARMERQERRGKVKRQKPKWGRR